MTTKKLKYKPGRSTTQGSKISPSIFCYNLGFIVKWFLDMINDHQQQSNTYCNATVYADDVAIYISCNIPNRLFSKITQIANAFSKIVQIYGAALEQTKTKVLVTKTIQAKYRSINFLNTPINTDTCVKWLGYNISLNNNNTIKINIPQGKIYAIKNNIRMFQLYNQNISDNRKFYKIYIRPIFDLWLIDTSLENEITKYECQSLKIIGQITPSARTEEFYKYLGITTVQKRLKNLALNLEEKDILGDVIVQDRILKSGKNKMLIVVKTLCDKLNNMCVQNATIEETPEFDEKSSCDWRKIVRKVAYNKAKYNNNGNKVK